MAFEHALNRRIIVGESQGKLLVSVTGQFKDFQELTVFTPGVPFAIVSRSFTD